MGLRILHSADWHLDSPLASLPDKARQQLRRAQEELADLVGEVCRREGCQLVLLSGDIFDGTPRPGTVDRLKRAMADWAVPVCIAPGNHDYFTQTSVWAQPWPENVHIFTGWPEYVDYPALDCRVYGAAYGSMDCPPLLEGFRAEGQARWCVGVLHGDPMNLHAPYCPVTAAQVRESGLDYLALGHLHTGGSFRAGDTLCAWPGCPMGRGWDETGQKGVLVVDLEQSAAAAMRPLPLPQFYDLTVSVSREAVAALEAVLPPVASPNLYRVTLRGSGTVEGNAIRARFSHLAHLELRDETQPQTDPFAAAGEDSLRGVFFQLLREQLEGANPEQAEVIDLAARVSAQLLEGREVTLP